MAELVVCFATRHRYCSSAFRQDVLTDLKADAEILPVEPMNEDCFAHKVCSCNDEFKLVLPSAEYNHTRTP